MTGSWSLRRKWLAAVGVGVTVFLAVAVLVIESLAVEFSAVVGVPIGLLAGLLASSLVARYYQKVGSDARALVDATAGFGHTVLVLAAVQYVGIGGFESALTLPVSLSVSVTAGILTGLASWLRARQDGSL